MRQFLEDGLSISSKERKGLIALMVLLLIGFIFNNYISLLFPLKPISTIELLRFEEWNKKNDSLAHQSNVSTSYKKRRYSKSQRLIIASNFDPNTASEITLEQNGFSAYCIKNIFRFREKGGVFRVKSDLKKVYGIENDFYEHIKQRMLLPDTLTAYQVQEYKSQRTARLIDVNNADTAAWKSLPGIGSKFATRIVNYRNALGGFVALEQLNEVYGLTPELLQSLEGKLELKSNAVQQLNINTASADELARHPYISKKKADALVLYRTKHGGFLSVEDIRKTDLFNEELYRKIVPYLRTE